MPEREAGSWRQLWSPPPHLPPNCNQSDWIRVRATLIISEVTQALQWGPPPH